jgi:hypothetical protein
MNDDDLASLIRQTQPKPEFPTSFQREVWARITVAEQQLWAARWRRFFLWIASPVPALATVMIMLGLGSVLGIFTASDNEAAQRSVYAASINPFKMSPTSMHE